MNKLCRLISFQSIHLSGLDCCAVYHGWAEKSGTLVCSASRHLSTPWRFQIAQDAMCTLGFSRNATKLCIATWLSHEKKCVPQFRASCNSHSWKIHGTCLHFSAY